MTLTDSSFLSSLTDINSLPASHDNSQIIQASAYGFYIIHGTLIGDPPVVLLGITSLTQSMVLIIQYFCFRNTFDKEKTAEEEEEMTPREV